MAIKSQQWGAVAVGGASGLLHALAFPGAAIAPLAVVAYLPLLLWLCIVVPRPRTALLAGLVAGTVLYLVGQHWIAFTLQEMSHMPAPVAWGALSLYAVVMAMHQAVWAAGAAVWTRWQARRGGGWALWACAVAVWMAVVEFVLPYQFPWYLGNALYSRPVWMQVADVAGIWLVTLLCVLMPALLVAAWREERAQRRALLLGMALCVGLGWWGYGHWRMAEVQEAPVRKELQVAMIQPNPSLAEKTSRKPAARIPMQDRAERLTRALLERVAGRRHIDLVVWSEGSMPFYYVHTELPPFVVAGQRTRAPRVVKQSTARLHAFARSVGKPLLVGALRRVDPQWRAPPRNSAILLRDGQAPQFYDKKMLVPFGERTPGASLFPALGGKIPGVSELQPGDEPAVVEVAGAKLGISICYEALFAGFMRQQSSAAEVLVNLTDDLWFGPTNAPELHLMVQAARAIELRRPLLRATATGVSTHIDALGRVRSRTPVWREATLVESVQVRDLDSVFRWLGLWPMRLLSALSLLWLVLVWRQELTLGATT